MICSQPQRGVLRIRGVDAKAWLDNLITNDITPGTDNQPIATHAALLGPQGKILFDLMVVDCSDHLLVETQRAVLAQAAQRLMLYKLRAAITIEQAPDVQVYVSPDAPSLDPVGAPVIVRDPRSEHLGSRIYLTGGLPESPEAQQTYVNRRVALVVPESGLDYPLGQTFPHEANFDLTHGVSFTKGCFIGQEVVARMQNKSVVRKRIVTVTGDALTTGCEIKAGAQVIGTIGTVAAKSALATIRLDRAVEAIDAGLSFDARGTVVTIDQSALATYRKAVLERPPAPDL